MSGRTIPLPAGSAAEGAIELVNQRLAQRRMAPIRIESWTLPGRRGCDGNGQAGILGFTVVEQPIAERWAKVLPKLRVDRHLVLDNRADMAWYVRRDASTLRATIDRFLADYRAPADQDVAFQRVYRRAYKVRNPSARRTWRLEAVRPLLQRYARQSSMDWLALAAVAYRSRT